MPPAPRALTTSAAVPSALRRELTAAEERALRRRRGSDLACAAANVCLALGTALFAIAHASSADDAFRPKQKGCCTCTARAAPKTAPCKRTTLSKLSVDGELTREHARRVLARVHTQVDYRYAKQRREPAQPVLAGDVGVSSIVDESGDVESAVVALSTLSGPSAPALEQCVRDVAARLRYPSAAGHRDDVFVMARFTFSPDCASPWR